MLLPLALLACKAPPEAPKALDDLTGYLFEHAADPDDDALVAASANLNLWLDQNLAATVEGYQVHALSTAAIEGTGDTLPDPGGLVGAAVGHESTFSAALLGGTNAVAPSTDLTDWDTSDADGVGRVYTSDPVCFAAATCPRLTSTERAVDSLPLGITSTTEWAQEWRWVNLPEGQAMLQRWWIVEPIDFNVSFLDVAHQYYVWVFLPREDGTSVSVQTVWIAATLTGAPVPEATAMNLVVGSMSDTATRLDERTVDP